jgi:hypothetical protein
MLKHPSYRTIIVIILLACTHVSRVAAQHEFVATIDQTNGIIKRLDSIPGVMYIEPHAILDDRNRRFLFVGAPPDRLTRSLFSIDAITGRVISQALLPKSPALITLRNNDVTQTLYGITVASGVYNLISIDPVTGAYTTIRQIKAMKSMSEEMIIDHTNQRIFLNCTDTSSRLSLISIDFSGNLLSQVSMPGTTGWQYDHTGNTIYGLRLNGPTSQHVIKIDPATGTITTVAILPAEVFGVLQFSSTFNEAQHQYIFASAGRNGDARLFSIDVNSGVTVYSTPAPVSVNAVDKDNLRQFRYSNSMNRLYSLHWKAFDDVSTPLLCAQNANTKVVFNRSGNFLTVSKPLTTCVVRMTLYTELGQLILGNMRLQNGYSKVQLPYLVAGVYYYKLFAGNSFVQGGKFLISR